MFTKTNAEAYFQAEKSEALLFMIMGLVALGAACWLFLFLKTPLAKGMAIPVALVALIQLAVGYTVHSRADKQRMDVVYNMDLNPDALRQKEVPRMKQVMRGFVVYRYVELALLVAGIVLVLLFRQQAEKTFWLGAGIGLALQAAIMLGADFFAEKRGRQYADGLNSWLQQH